MKEKPDPITEWTSAVKTRVGDAVCILALFAFVCGLIAPVFGPAIKNNLLASYVMDPNYETLAKEDMKVVWVLLWGWAPICWALLIWANLHPYGT